MGTSQHGVDVNDQPEVLNHLRERMSETDEFLSHHGVRAREKQEVLEQLSRESAYEHSDSAGCTKGRWTVSDWKKSESMQGSWVMSVSKWFADEKEDTGLQTAENSKFFVIASLIESVSNEVKELIMQYQTKSSLCQASSSKQKRPMQRTPGSLIRSLDA